MIRAIRVLTVPGYKDVFLSRTGDEVSMDVPGGRVTLVLNGGWSESGIGYCHLTYKAIRQGLLRPSPRGRGVPGGARHENPASIPGMYPPTSNP